MHYILLLQLEGHKNYQLSHNHIWTRFHSAVKAIVGIMHIYNTAICIEVEFEKPNQASIYFKSAQLLQVPTHPKGRPDLHSAANAAFTQSIPKKV